MATYIGKQRTAMAKDRAIKELAAEVEKKQKKYDKMQKRIGGLNKMFDIASMATMLIPGVGAGVQAAKAGLGKMIGKTALGSAAKKFGAEALKKTGLKALGGKMFKGAVGEFGKQVLGSALKRQLRQKGIEKLIKGRTKIGKIKSDSPFAWRAAEKYDKSLQEGMKFSGWGEGLSGNLMSSFIMHGGMEALDKLKKAKGLTTNIAPARTETTDMLKGRMGEEVSGVKYKPAEMPGGKVMDKGTMLERGAEFTVPVSTPYEEMYDINFPSSEQFNITQNALRTSGLMGSPKSPLSRLLQDIYRKGN